MSEYKLYKGDCLELMREIPDGSIDMVLCDPPYMINTKSDGSGKISPWADYCNAAFWYTAWIREARRILKGSGCLWSFLNWRSFVTFQKSACDIGWPIVSVLIWDKKLLGPGGACGLRPCYEMLALWGKPDFRIENRSLRDIQQFAWQSTKPNHPAEKPVSLLAWLIENCSKHGGTILDCFMGSGSTGVACMETGRDFIGIEMDDTYFATAERRIAEAKELYDARLFKEE